MELYASCDCGWHVRDVGEKVMEALRDHGITAHGIRLTDEQILAVSRPVAAPQDRPRSEEQS